MSVRNFAILAAFATLLGSSCQRRPLEPRKTPLVRVASPNILLISVDTLRADHLGHYGYARSTSPTLDRLAGDGVIFDQAVTPIPKTTPALASLLSGLQPSTHKVITLGAPLDRAVRLVSEQLEDAGYATIAVCAQHNCHSDYGLDRGFDVYDDEFAAPYGRGVKVERQGGQFHPESEKRAEQVADSALAWLDERNRDKPFFMWLHFMDPHAGYAPPPPFTSMFDSTRAGEPPSPLVRNSIFGSSLPEGLIDKQARVPGRTDYAYYLDAYDGEIRYMDHHVGRVLDRLREDGLYDDALIVVTADHGEYMGESHRGLNTMDHGWTPYDAELRVPLVLKLPGRLKAGTRSAALVSLVDVAPTLMDFVDVSGGYEGVSLLEPLLGRPPRAAQVVQMPFANASFIVRTQQQKVIFRSKRALSKLRGRPPHRWRRFAHAAYDLRKDRLERVNVLQPKRREWLPEATSELARSLGRKPAVVVPDKEPAKPSAEALEHLRALGYAH